MRGSHGPARAVTCTLHTPPLVVGKQIRKGHKHLTTVHKAEPMDADRLRQVFPTLTGMIPENYKGMVWVLAEKGQQVAYPEEKLLQLSGQKARGKQEQTTEPDITIKVAPIVGLTHMTRDLEEAHALIKKVDQVLSRVLHGEISN